MLSQVVERTWICAGDYRRLRGESVKTNKVFCEIIVWLHVDLHEIKAWPATELLPRCFRILILGKWKLDYMFIHSHVQNHSKLPVHESVNSKFTKLTQMLVKMPLFDKDSLSYESFSRFA